MFVEIPNQSSFKLDEVCQITGVRPYVLRFWESEFDEIQPITSASGQKVYEHKDVLVVLKIKSFVVDKKLTIIKAKKLLAAKGPVDLNEKEESVKEDKVQETLSESNLQKLVLAKAKLQSIIVKTQSMQNFLNGPQ